MTGGLAENYCACRVACALSTSLYPASIRRKKSSQIQILLQDSNMDDVMHHDVTMTQSHHQHSQNIQTFGINTNIQI